MRLKNVSSSQAASSRLVSAQQDKRGGDTLSSVWPGLLGRGVNPVGSVPCAMVGHNFYFFFTKKYHYFLLQIC